ncbi:pilus assembly protein [uncultured Massilia sp.]|uniref:pilus assembly protein n=1 Tax=uncultured Massilia sp. TaxID=169973 RepID=UPI0025E70A99|nr:pilus assembly protein [uncultured Massilia sp.]
MLPLPRRPRARAQRGVALVCALLLLAAAMVIGVAVVRGAFALLASARNEGDRIAARAMAGAALRDAERDIAGAAATARAAWFDPAGGGDFPGGCGSGATDLGLCRAASPPAWQRVDLAAADPGALVPYGRFSGAVLPVGSDTLPARLPRYLIEKLEPAGADAAHGSFYRITAIGFGMRASTWVVLQALYRKPRPAPPDGHAGEHAGEGAGAGGPGQDASGGGDAGPPAGQGPAQEPEQSPAQAPAQAPPAAPDHQPADPPRTLPAGRIGWREIANWPELHARANQ